MMGPKSIWNLTWTFKTYITRVFYGKRFDLLTEARRKIVSPFQRKDFFVISHEYKDTFWNDLAEKILRHAELIQQK